MPISSYISNDRRQFELFLCIPKSIGRVNKAEDNQD